jgi:hypothetical protein
MKLVSVLLPLAVLAGAVPETAQHVTGRCLGVCDAK